MRALTVTLVVVATGCGGNWSNGDLVFANALPRTEDLRSTLPSSSTAQPLEGVSTRRDGLMVGDPSNAWALTRRASSDYNGILVALLGILDQARRAPPTERTPTSRTWGPFADSNNAGRELRVVISQTDDTRRSFGWQVESRPFNGEWLQVITGNFLTNGETTVRKGQGAIQVPVKDFRDVIKTDANIAQLDLVTIGYVTDSWPNRVEMNFTLKPGGTTGLSALGYTSLLQEDGGGSMRFVWSNTDVNVEQLEITARWMSTGEGRAFGVVQKGNYTGANVTECWNRSFTVTHYAESWQGGMTAGTESSCVTFP